MRSRITHGNYAIKMFAVEFIPGFAAHTPIGNLLALERFQRFRMHLSGGETTGTHGLIASLAEMIDQRFRHNGTTGITRA